MKRLGIGLVGSGFMGRSHAHAFRAAPGVFDLPLTPVLELLADVNAEAAAQAAAGLGFARSTGDWRDARRRPRGRPRRHHRAEHASQADRARRDRGRQACLLREAARPERDEAKEMVDAAEAAGVPTAVGFNYLKNPMVALAREIVESGEIGEVVSFRGIHAEDYMTDPTAPFTWRLDPKGGHGVVADLGSHIISIARFVVGPIDSAGRADQDGRPKERPVARVQPRCGRSRSTTRRGRSSASPAAQPARSRRAGSRPAAR